MDSYFWYRLSKRKRALQLFANWAA